MKAKFANLFQINLNRVILLNEENGLLKNGQLVIFCEIYHRVNIFFTKPKSKHFIKSN